MLLCKLIFACFKLFLPNLVTSDIDSAKTCRAGFDFRIKYSSRGLLGVTLLVHEARPTRLYLCKSPTSALRKKEVW